jgi:hypothetical protein
MDKAQQLGLLAGQHQRVLSSPARSVKNGLRLKTNHEQTLSVPYVFRNHLISGEEVERVFKLCANARI